MKSPKISKKELVAIAPNINAVEFEALCERNRIHTSWLDIDNLMNYNEGYYNVEVVEFGIGFSYYNGKLEDVFELNY